MTTPPQPADQTRSGFILADVLAGLGILAAGLAAFLGCMSQGHRMMRRADDLQAWRMQAELQLAVPPSRASAVLARPLTVPYPGPARLRDAGTGLCAVSAAPIDRASRPPVRTVRFCVEEGAGG